MPQRSAGIMLFRRNARDLEVMLVHPGGPFWRNKDDGAWSVPKGLYETDEDPLVAARREFQEETGTAVDGDFIDLGDFRQSGGKTVRAFALEGDFNVAAFRCNTFTLEWPPKSGRMQDFPECDRAEWFAAAAARRKLVKGQAPIVDALIERLGL
jgi:predicted NUDIX family NTP pyrophosphohydrolase